MEYGVVLMLDALGVKGIWQRENPDDVIKRWETLCKDALIAEGEFNGTYSIYSGYIPEGKNRFSIKWQVSMFSDTIIFTGIRLAKNLASLEDKFILLYEASNLASRLIGGGLDHNVRLRGALSIGDLAKGENIILGPAVDEAASWYERANWIGAILTPSAVPVISEYYSDEMHSLNREDVFSLWAQWKVPLKGGGHFDTYAVGWPFTLDFKYWSKGVGFSQEAREDLLRSLEDMTKGAQDVVEKFENTVEFYDAYRKHNFDQNEQPMDRLLSGMF